MTSKLGVFANKWFSTYFLAATLSNIGSQIYKLAIPWLVLNQTGSVGMMSAMWVAEIAPFVVLGPFLGVFIDRWDRRKVMLWSDFLRAALVTLIPVLAAFDMLQLWMVFVTGFLVSICTLCFDLVADFGMLPQLVKEEQLTEANSAYRGMDQLSRLLGPALAGALIAFTGPIQSILIDAVSYFCTFAVIFFIPVNFNPVGREKEKMTVGGVFKNVGEGFAFIKNSPILGTLALVGCFINLGIGAVYTVMTYFLGNELNLSSTVVGSVYSVMGIMAISGSFLAPRLLKKFAMGRAFTLAVCGSLIGTVFMASMSDWRLVMIGYAFMNLSMAMLNIFSITVRQREIPNQFMGRVNSVFRMLLTVSFPLSAAILGGVANAFGATTAFIASSLLMAVVVGITLLSKVPGYREEKSPVAQTDAQAT